MPTPDEADGVSFSTGNLSRLSYNCIPDPTRKAHDPQKVAKEVSYATPEDDADAGPRAPQSWWYRLIVYPCTTTIEEND